MRVKERKGEEGGRVKREEGAKRDQDGGRRARREDSL